MVKFIASIFWGFIYAILILIVGLDLLLCVVAETFSGRLFAIATLLIASAIVMVRWRKVRHIARCITALAIAAAILWATCYLITPKGSTPDDSSIQSIFLTGPTYKRASIANLVPEIDQIKLASYLVSTMDPFVDGTKAKRIRNLFLDTYGPMRKSRDFESTGSVMNYAYRDLFLETRPNQHFYIYVPPSARGKTVPLIVFLHGSGGNFKMYMWKWREFAMKHNVVVVAPSFGFGFWDREGAPELLNRVLEYCETTDVFSISRKYLIGLSNGGIGVYRFGAADDHGFDGLVLISPVMQSEHGSDQRILKQWASRPVLVIHGTEDERIPLDYVRMKTKLLRDGGVKTQLEVIEKEDHFLFLSSWEKVSAILGSWMNL